MKKYIRVVEQILESLLSNLLSLELIKKTIELPQDKEKGDIAFPFFAFAKIFKKAPNKIAEEIFISLEKNKIFEEKKNIFSKVEIDGAYLNFFIKKEILFMDSFIFSVKEKKEKKSKGKAPIIIEFSSPNIAKPFHIGHIRSTVIGNALANIYEYLGHKVIRMNYLGDYGTQFGKMIIAYRKWGNKEEIEKDPIRSLLSYYTKFHEEAEKDDTLENEARKAFYNLENNGEEEIELWKWFKNESIKEFNRVYELLGVKFDVISGESLYQKKLDMVNDLLIEKGLLEESDGAMIVELDGFDSPAIIKKSDGTSLYTTRDIAAVLDRWEEYHFEKCLYIVASQQNLHFKQWFKITESLGLPFSNRLFHIPFGLVSLEGRTLSTRKGDIVLLEDVLLEAISKTEKIIKEKGSFKGDIEKLSKEVGIGAVIFNELSKDRVKDYVFSWDQILNFEGETGPYVQYTYARFSSVLEKSGKNERDILEYSKALIIDDKRDDIFQILKIVSSFDDTVLKAARENEPAIITRSILSLAKLANKFYHDNKILSENDSEENYCLSIVIIIKETIKKGLSILGVNAPIKM
ncbi:MAG: arginine--tRNA ligase [Clostridiales Family XIII bacterium]|jgi:arginyl-tRNA synthetase|nr:arginine--tRNA ligase [Clostridiales Family XIII bacterium]